MQGGREGAANIGLIIYEVPFNPESETDCGGIKHRNENNTH